MSFFPSIPRMPATTGPPAGSRGLWVACSAGSAGELKRFLLRWALSPVSPCVQPLRPALPLLTPSGQQL